MSAWGQRVSEFMGLGLITVAMSETCSAFFGVHDRAPTVMVAVACASYPAQQLLAIRRFRAEATRVVTGPALWSLGPLMLLPLLVHFYPGLASWSPVGAPPPMLREAGLLLSIAMVFARPLFGPAQSGSDSPFGPPPITAQSLLIVLCLLLVSYSVAASALTVYWFVAHGIERLATRLRNR